MPYVGIFSTCSTVEKTRCTIFYSNRYRKLNNITQRWNILPDW